MSKKELARLPDEAVANALEADVNGVDLRFVPNLFKGRNISFAEVLFFHRRPKILLIYIFLSSDIHC